MEEPKIISKKIAFWLIIGFIIVGAYLRIQNLGRYSFWTDEFFHVFGAQGILETGKPILPSGELYSRSIIYTYIVAFFFKLFGISEISARMPSVIFSVVTIPVTYYIVSHLLNRNTGVISAFLVAFSPFNILWAQQCRMYSLFQPIFLLSAFCFFKAFENDRERTVYPFNSLKNYLPFLILFGLSFHIHETTILFIPIVLAYCIVMFLYLCLNENFTVALRSKYLKTACLLFIVALAMLVFKIFSEGSNISGIVNSSTWYEENAHNINYYRKVFQDTYPLFSYLYPLALLMVIIKKPALGIFIGKCFLIPFLALSFAFTLKGYRYIFFIFPFFLITISILVEHASFYSWKFFNLTSLSLLANTAPKKRRRAVFIVSSFSLLFMAYPLLFPWIKISPKEFSDFGMYSFNTFALFIKQLPKEDIILCTEPFLIDHYTARKPDYIILTDWFGGGKETYDAARIDGKTGKRIDRSCGIIVIDTLKQFTDLEKNQQKIWIITNKYFLQPPAPEDEDVLGYVKQNYKKHTISDVTFEVYYKE